MTARMRCARIYRHLEMADLVPGWGKIQQATKGGQNGTSSQPATSVACCDLFASTDVKNMHRFFVAALGRTKGVGDPGQANGESAVKAVAP